MYAYWVTSTLPMIGNFLLCNRCNLPTFKVDAVMVNNAGPCETSAPQEIGQVAATQDIRRPQARLTTGVQCAIQTGGSNIGESPLWPRRDGPERQSKSKRSIITSRWRHTPTGWVARAVYSLNASMHGPCSSGLSTGSCMPASASACVICRCCWVWVPRYLCPQVVLASADVLMSSHRVIGRRGYFPIVDAFSDRHDHQAAICRSLQQSMLPFSSILLSSHTRLSASGSSKSLLWPFEMLT